MMKPLPLFDVHTYFFKDKEIARAFIRENSATPDDTAEQLTHWRGFCHTVTDREGKDLRMMCVFDTEDTLNTVVHEAVHMAWLTLRHVGIPVKSETNEEPLAYLTAWFACEMLKFIQSGSSD